MRPKKVFRHLELLLLCMLGYSSAAPSSCIHHWKSFSPYCYSCQASRFTICYSIFSISPLFHLSICTLKSHAQPLCLDFNLLKIHLPLTLVAKQQKLLRRFLKGNLISFGRFKFLTFRKKEDFFFFSLWLTLLYALLISNFSPKCTTSTKNGWSQNLYSNCTCSWVRGQWLCEIACAWRSHLKTTTGVVARPKSHVQLLYLYYFFSGGPLTANSKHGISFIILIRNLSLGYFA